MSFKPLLERVDRWLASKKKGGLVWERDVLECLKKEKDELKRVLDWTEAQLEAQTKRPEDVLAELREDIESVRKECFGEVSEK